MADTANQKEAQLKWARLRSKWQQACKLPGHGTWLDVKLAPWGVGCKACKAAGLTGSLAQYGVRTTAGLQMQNFLKHQKSASHKEAVSQFVGGSSSTAVGAPPPQSFQALIDESSAGRPPGCRKNRQMTFCLAEAAKALDQDFVAKASKVCLFRDERKGRLLLRFRAVDKNLLVRSGTMGLAIQPGTGARNITEATRKIMKRFCTRFAGCPNSSRKDKKAKPFLKVKLFKHLTESVTCIAVDAAADEVLSSELMRASAWNGSQQKLTPNLRFVVRDKAHASRRITSRPWSADDVLKDVMQFMCGGRHSIAKLLQFSEEIKRIFVEFTTSTDTVLKRAVSDFRAAAHRFESHAKPLGRTCLYIHACIRTALRLTKTRSDASGQKAKAWLLWLSEERALLAAMLADAADSSIRLTRLMDTESVDPAMLCREVSLYMSSVKGLFLHGACFTEFGFTSTMLETLKTPIVFQLGSETKSFGDSSGVPEEIKKRCLARMQAWLKLAEAAVAAEFPSFEIAQAFDVFDLSGGSHNADEKLQRVAKACNLDEQALKAQWRDVYPRAERLLKQSTDMNAKNKDAWALALDRLCQHHYTKGQHPVEILREALIQYFSFGASSSGVEQSFSKSQWGFGTRRNSALHSTEEFSVKALLDLPAVAASQKDRLIRLARLTWVSCFGQSRSSTAERVDKGSKRKTEDDEEAKPATEAAFLRKRRRGEALAAGRMEGNSEVALDLHEQVWTQKHQKELEFQQRKRKMRKLQAFSENSLLQREIEDGMQQAAWAGKKVYLAVPANMHLVQGISDMGLAVTNQGAVLKRRAAAAIKRVLIVSKACAKKCPKFWRFLRSCLPENHKWTMAKTALSAIRAAHGRFPKKNVWVVVLPGQRNHQDIQGLPNVFTMRSLPKRICNSFDPGLSRSGSALTCLDSAWLALKRMKVKAQLCFNSDSDANCKKLLQKIHKPEAFHDDIAARKPQSEQYVDLYVTTPPCQPFSMAGQKKGLKDKRGQLLKFSVAFVSRQKPRVVVLENVAMFASKKFKPVTRGLQRAFKKLGYVCFARVLNSADFKVSQARRRFFLVAIRKDSLHHPFHWPQPVGKRNLEDDLDPARPSDRPGRLPKTKRARDLALAAYGQVWKKQKLDPRQVPVAVDIDCSPRFASYGVNQLKTLTKSRGSCGGHWLSNRGRKMTINELMRVTGINPIELRGYKEEGISDAQLGGMLGNSIPVPLILGVLTQAMKAGGLLFVPKGQKET
ncbi:haeIIM [Symbiodinium sp. CCMP2592]|nr:haeIIM [Symbiodinium sp. CCMP2592]